jgi:hypothetical protein
MVCPVPPVHPSAPLRTQTLPGAVNVSPTAPAGTPKANPPPDVVVAVRVESSVDPPVMK